MDNEMESLKAQYLQMIQEPINRMSTNSAIFKGFAANVAIGISDLLPVSHKGLVAFIPIAILLTFLMLDVYYLRIERKYRYLFDQVRCGRHEIDFSMDLTVDPVETLYARANIRACVFTKSIMLFYVPLIIVVVIIIKLRIEGVI